MKPTKTRRAVILLPAETAAWTALTAAFLLRQGWRVSLIDTANPTDLLPAEVLIVAEHTPLDAALLQVVHPTAILHPTDWGSFTSQLASLPTSNTL